jgi:transglutaminase-like putative cysteine protease
MTIPDRRRSADEVIDSGAGDCEGFAAVSKSVLERLGIASEIVVIEFDSLSIKHAVCVFRDGQNYSIISNQDLIRTDATNCEDAVKAVYPDWRRIIYVSTKMEYLRIVEH